jgi:alanine dehydrogenase
MDIGIPVEKRPYEFRTGLSPQGVHLLTQSGHRCYVERGTGDNVGFSEADYQRAGATIVYSGEEVYQRSELVVKVGAPTQAELPLLRDGQAIIAFWHLAAQPREVIQTLIDKRITAIAFETIQRDDGTLTVLQPLSEIAGRMAPQIAARWLQNDGGGAGMLIGGVAGVPPIDVCIIGAGTVGYHATRAFLNAGARVFLLDKDLARLQKFEDRFNGQIVTMVAYDFNIARVIGYADVLVCAALIPGQRAPVLVSRQAVARMRPRSVIIDFAIDQGGCVETSRPTTHANPVFVEENVIHYCVPNVTSVVARTATHAYLNAAWPYGQLLAEVGVERALGANAELMRGVAIHNGEVLHENLASLLKG